LKSSPVEIAMKMWYEAGAKSIDQIPLARMLNHSADFVIVVGTGNIDRVRRAVKAEQIKLSCEQWFIIWRASMGRVVP